MSPHAANSLVHDLVQMAQAMERLPQVESNYEEALGKISEQADIIQRLELKLMEKTNRIEELHSEIRTAEASRDDAELRFLEADERTTQALAFVRTVFGNAGSLIQALDPPRVAEPKASEPQSTGQSGSDPIGAPFQSSDGAKASDAGSGEPMPATQEPVSVQADPTPAATDAHSSGPTETSTAPTVEGLSGSGQSEPDPTAHTHASPDNGETQSGTGDATSAASASTEPPSPGPYHNRRYIDVPHYVSLDNWTAGGGTVDDYYASRRPNLAV